MKEIKKYKGVSLKYSEENGNIYFNFEGREYLVKYVFEAEQIINEPRWINCNLEGYFVGGYIDKYIGFAKATKKDIKNKKPDWLIKGEYDTEFRKQKPFEDFIIYPKNKFNDDVYNKWEEQRKVYFIELKKLNNIVSELKNN